MAAGIEASRLSKSLDGGEILKEVSFRAEPGDILAIIGPSGSGKTTLFRCLLGELRPDEGAVLVDGSDVLDVPIERRGVGIVYQNYALFPHLTVEQNIAYGLRARRRPEAQVKERVAEMVRLVHLEGKEQALPPTLSGGERQRVALARALAVEPRVLLLDEAFTALDPSTRSDVILEVRSIIRGLRLTTLLITHDQEEAFLFARRTLVLNEGRVVIEGEAEQVIAHDHPFVRDFVKMVRLERAKVQAGRDGMFADLADGTRIPLHMPNVEPGEEVQIIVKKGRGGESVGVWSLDDG